MVGIFKEYFSLHRKAITWVPTVVDTQVLDYLPKGFISLG
jgi:hypothetical protein